VLRDTPTSGEALQVRWRKADALRFEARSGERLPGSSPSQPS
jgi:hypothetical protein